MDHVPDDHAESATPAAGSAGMPRWVKVSLAVAAVLLVLAIAVMLLFGGGEHGPGRHLGGAAPTSPTLDQPSRGLEPAR
jgi:hypothetical protein